MPNWRKLFPEPQPITQFPAIHIAASEGNLDTIASLVGSGTPVDTAEECGITPLMIAAARGQIETLRFLLHRGAEVNSRSTDGTTPLMWAVGGGSREAVHLLLTAGADPNVRDTSRRARTALILALKKCPIDADLVRLLLQSGADANAVDSLDGTALEIALRRKDFLATRMLIEFGASSALSTED